MKKPLYKLIAQSIGAKQTSLAAREEWVERNHEERLRKYDEWIERHEERLRKYEKLLPSGSGFDNGTTIDTEESSDNNLVFETSYHTMQEGFYGPWIEMTVTVTPDLIFGFELNIDIHNRDKLEIELDDELDYHLDYFYDVFVFALREKYDPEKI